MNDKPKKLLDQVRERLRLKHYSIRTEQAYVQWIRRYILFHNKQHPKDMGDQHIGEFLIHLAIEKKVASNTQNQALSALLFLYREILQKEITASFETLSAAPPKRLPSVLTHEEAQKIIRLLKGDYQLIAKLLYGSGMRVNECLRMRIKDIDFEYRTITVRDGKGANDRVTVLPDSLILPIKEHFDRIKMLHADDIAKGFGGVSMPTALDRKYPKAPFEWVWYYVFPSSSWSIDPRSGKNLRHHLHASGCKKLFGA